MKKLVFLFLVSVLTSPWLLRSATPARALDTADIGDFQTVAPGQGWLRYGANLFWTSNDGLSWQDITPPLAGEETIQAVHYADPTMGWALLGSGLTYTLAATADGGASWQRRTLDLPGMADSLDPPAAAFMGWLDGSHGWLVLKLATGSSFSLGVLFVTDDGGQTWQPRTIPVGEPATFPSDRVGWTAGGPAGDSLFRTLDGGLTWEAQGPAGTGVQYLLPRFDDESNGLLPVLAAEGAGVRADFYATGDGGQNWTLVGSFPLPADTPMETVPSLALLGAGGLVLSMPNSNGIVRAESGQFELIANQDGKSAGLTQLSMSTVDAGWGLAQSGSCESQPDGSLTCSRETRLLGTSDGGLHWTPIPLPPSGETVIAESFALSDKLGNGEAVSIQDADTQVYTGQGFDKCGLPSLSSMQTWWNSSPYNAFNLYIGGDLYACRATSLPTEAYVASLSAQGWRFFPTWVGPQAPCMSDRYRLVFSYNTTTAYNQGVAEASKAMAVATNLELAAADGSGTVIYYDLETYGTTDSCRNAAKAFIAGWTNELNAHNNLSGVYGSACYNAADWWTIANPPDAVWLAHWYSNPAYMPAATTADSCVSSSLWPNHQRLRQYAGDHTEVWGGVSLGGIDSNALDGPLTVRDGTGGVSLPSTPLAANPINGGSVSRNTDTWLIWKTTGNTCSVYVNGQNVSSNGICSTYHLGLRPIGVYSWQVVASNTVGSTVGPVWQFTVGPFPPGTLSASPASATQINLSWGLSSDDPTYVDGYRIYADGALAGSVPRGVNTFQLANLGCGTTHSIHVKATWQGTESIASSVASATTLTCAPVLISPAPGATTLTTRPTFSWQPASGATGYKLHVSQNPSFSTPDINVSLSGTGYTPPLDLLAKTVYYWRVRSSGAYGNSDWSVARAFITGTPPGVPGLTSPGSNALVKDYTPLLDWTDPIFPDNTYLDHYQVQVATTSAFALPLYDATTLSSDFTVPSDLAANTPHYWRVRAFNNLGQYNTWTGPWIFRTAITPPVLTAPVEGTQLLARRLTLDWEDVVGASSYYVRISRYADFSSVVKSATVTPSTYAVTSDLPANTVLYWEVQANGANGPSLWSSVRSFTTGNPPSVPALQYPANGALLTAYQPTLNWSSSTLPLGTMLDHYQVQLATDSGFVSLLYDQNPVDSQFPLPAPLAPNARYYWRVRAFNTGGHYSSWTSARYFKAAILPTTLIDPLDATALLTRRVTFDWQDVTGASSYLIHISRYANFSSILKSATVAPSTYAVSSDLPANTLLYWRVQAKGANGPSLWSSVRSFTTGNPPSVPSLQSPASNALLTSYLPALNWSDSTLPIGTTLDHYQVQLAADSAFSALSYDTSAVLSEFSVPAPLAPNAKYYWRVRAFNTAGHYSTWSSVRYFRTVIAPPVLLAPANGAVLGTRRPAFDWDAVVGATGYTIQVSKYSNFSSTLLNVNVSGSAYTPGTNLPTGITLYWRVRARGPNGPSLWAEVPARTFKIVLP